ncbi:MAG: glycoside hydrolase family 3 C-terminal domain-containing protein [Actinomycetota bacterium]|nr:glycoside hydrolase family 3 C-terminal domain-containing protein [Actinomycetota bacterium]
MRDIDELIGQMTIEEKALLTTGATMWSTNPIDRFDIPSVTVTDGPAGARGPITPGIGTQVATLCIPCGSALGATFDVSLLEELGVALGHQTRSKGARVLLAPTINLHRSPLFGRAFECYSEDPLLSGKLAASFIRGAQSRGIATTVKHFVGNDAEFERMTINSVIDQRTLREVYLLPFEIAVREGGSLGIMTSYNRMNGVYCAENRQLLQDILRDEWGFKGFVVTDWFAGFTTEGAANAGLDLEMPAPPRGYGKFLAEAVREGRVDEEDLNRAVRTLLSTFERLGALDDQLQPPMAIDLPEHRQLARRAAAGSLVLLRNEKVKDQPLLPLQTNGLKTVAVIGPNAERTRIMGGGSAEVLPHHRTAIIDVLRERLGKKVSVRHEAGGNIDKTTPTVDPQMVRRPDGTPGFEVIVFDGNADNNTELTRVHRPDGRILLVARNDADVPTSSYHFNATGIITVETSGQYIVSLVEVSPCRLLLDGKLVVDGASTIPPRGQSFFGMGSVELTAIVDLVAGQPHQLVLECDASNKQWAHGAQVGLQFVEQDDPVRRAVELAAECDLALVVVGTTDDWESEGHDRDTLNLPGRQVELIRAVAEANKKTIVLVNTGAPVDMSWANEVPSIMQIWFGGQEMGHAVVDVLLGEADPGGRLPTTIPERIEHTPAYGNFPGEHGQVRYGEGVFIGYRWYEARHLPVRFPFGHGLSYTTFEIGQPDCEDTEISSAHKVTIRIPVTNTGSRIGTEVVQVYVAPRNASVQRPNKELKSFAKVSLKPGESTNVTIELSPRDFAFWNPGDIYRSVLRPQVTGESANIALDQRGDWQIDQGLYDIHIGTSSVNIAHQFVINISDNNELG